MLPVSEDKKRGLVSLCDQGVIPNHYRESYDSLPTAADLIDRIPEPNYNESSEDSEID